jgi:hypothetical protein
VAALLVVSGLALVATRFFEDRDMRLSDAEKIEQAQDTLDSATDAERDAFTRMVTGMPDQFTPIGTSVFEAAPDQYQATFGLATGEGQIAIFYSASGASDMVGPEAICLLGPDNTQLPLAAILPDTPRPEDRYRGVAIAGVPGGGAYRVAWACTGYSFVDMSVP